MNADVVGGFSQYLVSHVKKFFKNDNYPIFLYAAIGRFGSFKGLNVF